VERKFLDGHSGIHCLEGRDGVEGWKLQFEASLGR
jgi:hypothetical protein